MNAEELLKKLDAERDAYLATFQQLHEVFARNFIASSSSSSSSSPTSTFVAPPSRPVLDRVGRLSMSESERKPPATFKSSFISNEDDELSDDDEALYVQDLLPTATFVDEDLRTHLKRYKWNHESKSILEDILTEEGRMKHPNLFPSGQNPDQDGLHFSLYQVFDVGTDGAPVPLHVDSSLMQLPKGQTMWHYIKDVNVDKTRRQAVGRITILREPSPTLFAAAHLTLNGLFDMDEIFKHLVQQGTTSAYMTRAFSDDARKQRSFVFSFEYFTVIGEECQPMAWQAADQERERKDSHIPISRCSSVVALSLIGAPIRKLKNSARRAATQYGFVYDPWSPWHVLNMQCYPDWKSNTDSHDSTKHYVNGPDAFLNTLLVEYKDAQKRYEEISQRVTKLVTPPSDFMFNSNIRDKLLFEDSGFTNSRRYFWAFQTLGTMNQSIKAMVDAYEDTFTKDVWEGRHKTLWPLADVTSSRNAYWKKRMASLKRDFESEIAALKVIVTENDDRRKDIKNLRDNLFSGTSVLESRKSVEQTEITVIQGRNIKLLTVVNMFFLPLTFVTSVFGMTNMPSDADFWKFGVALVTICVPFFLLIGSMNTNSGMKFWTEQFVSFWVSAIKILTWMRRAKSTRKSSAASMTSDNSTEMLQKQGRSLSASEGIARRAGVTSRLEKKHDSAQSPSPGKPLSFSHPLPVKEESGPPSSHVNPSEPSKDVKNKEECRTQPNSVLNLSASPSLQKIQPVLTAVSSNAITSETSDAPESPPSRAAFQRNDRGLWGRLTSSKRRNGGREYPV